MTTNALLLTLTLLALASADYDARIAHELAGMSWIAYDPVASINDWTCDYCSDYQLTMILAVTGEIQWFIGYSPTLSGIVLSFRGSDNIDNWITDLSISKTDYPLCEGCKVHSGFFSAWEDIKHEVLSAVTNWRTFHPDANIYVTGHSLGGAMAVLASAEIQQGVHSLYTFGEPRVGNAQFSAWFSQIVYSYRVIHDADIVPHIPWASSGFFHQGEQIWYDQTMITYKTCGYGENDDCSNSLGIFYSAGDHSMTYYLTLPVTFVDQVKLYLASLWKSLGERLGLIQRKDHKMERWESKDVNSLRSQ